MNDGIIASRYAEALLEYSEKEGVSADVYGQMQSLAASFAGEPRLRIVLLNPVLGRADRLSLLRAAIGEKISSQTDRFLELVMSHHRENLLQSIALGFGDLYRKAHNIHRVYLETAVALPAETQSRLKKYIGDLAKGTVELDLHVDESLIGGFVFRMDFQEMDASVARQLKDIKKQFTDDSRPSR